MSLFKGINNSFAQEMIRAASICGRSIEEEGGIIMTHGTEAEFVKIRSIHVGTTTAHGLYEADKSDFGQIITPMVRDGWKITASFHTHPAFSATPSNLDLNVLFRGFKHNVIYATERNVFSYSVWTAEDLNTFYMTADTLKQVAYSNYEN
jgi:proteasome lid subunit RPN8/RPN11